MAHRQGWSHEELLVAAWLYCRIPFGRFHKTNPDIVHAAEALGRTSAAVAMKLSNLASVDPTFRKSGRRGLSGASAGDRAIWEEMAGDWPRFAERAEGVLQRLGLDQVGAEEETELGVREQADQMGIERPAMRRERVGQDLFRDAVLSAYDHTCCISGLAVPPLLNASHIAPWRSDPANRLNPANGLCLSALHDRAFDRGYLTIRDDLTVQVSKRVRDNADAFFEYSIGAYDGSQIAVPEKFAPDPTFLDHHRTEIFID